MQIYNGIMQKLARLWSSLLQLDLGQCEEYEVRYPPQGMATCLAFFCRLSKNTWGRTNNLLHLRSLSGVVSAHFPQWSQIKREIQVSKPKNKILDFFSYGGAGFWEVFTRRITP